VETGESNEVNALSKRAAVATDCDGEFAVAASGFGRLVANSCPGVNGGVRGRGTGDRDSDLEKLKDMKRR
jgi:hypothetical protein